jgi:catalase
MLMWLMSDRAIPQRYATMEGFGVHTFRLVNAEGVARFVKFHWKPLKGVCSLVWDEAQLISGRDPDFNRRDLWEAIERGDFPEWELGFQIVEEADEHKFDFDLLDATKIIPEELVPVVKVGKMTLNRNPDNFFAETEQVAFHTGHIIPGIDFTNDPLLQGRLFSYIDTQLRRVGPNFHEIPINRSLRPADNNQRDGFARMTINKGRTSYFPNSLGGGCPMHAPGAASAFRSLTIREEGGAKVRERSESFADHFSQATQFWNSMSDWEKDHIAAAFAFELNQVVDEIVRDRAMNEILVNIDPDLAALVSEATGIAVAPAGTREAPTPSAPTPAGPLKDARKLKSPALSMDRPPPTIKGRKVAILVGDGVDASEVEAVLAALAGTELLAETIGPRAGAVKAGDVLIKINRAAPNAPSVIYDAVLVPGGIGPTLAMQSIARRFIHEAWRHGKPIAVAPDARAFLEAAGVPSADQGIAVWAPPQHVNQLIDNLRQHRFPRRASMLKPV